MKYYVVKRSKLTGYLCIISFILNIISYPLTFLIGNITPLMFMVTGISLSALFLPLSIHGAFKEKKIYSLYGSPGRWPSQTSPNEPIAPFFSIAYGCLIFIVILLNTFLIPTVVVFSRQDIVILVIIDILWGFSAGIAICGGILYDEKKTVMFGKENLMRK